MSLECFADWLDKNSCCDDAAWSNFFNEEYCKKCEAIKCTYADAKEILGIQAFSYGGNVDCAYCEVYGKCKFFPEIDDIPSNKDIIKLWLEGEAE